VHARTYVHVYDITAITYSVVDLSIFSKGGRQLVRNCEIMNAQTSVLNKERVIIIVIIIIIMLEPAETHLEF